MAEFRLRFEQDLHKPITVRHDPSMVFTGDSGANAIAVALYQDGAAYTPSGTVSCNVIRPDGVTITDTGYVSGNEVVAVLPANALSIPGPIGVYIKLTSGSAVATVFAGVFTVILSSTSSVVVASDVLTDIDALIAAVEAAVATIPPDYSDVIKALPAVTGYAYPFPATTWASSSSIDKDTGAVVTPDPNWSASDYIEIDPLYGSLKIVASGTSNGIYNAYYDESKTYISALTWGKNTTTILTPPANAKYIRLSKLDGTTLTVSLIPRNFKTWSLMSREPVSTDLNDFDLPGLYMLFASETYINSPDNTTTRRCLFVFRYPDEAYTAQLFLIYYDEHTRAYMRVRSGATPTWQDWHRIYDAEKLREGAISAKTVSEGFTPTPQSALGNNTGTNLRVMQYNVAHYNHDTATYLPNDKAFNFRKLLRATNPDILLLQEDNAWIDGPEPTGTKSAKEYLYNPQYPYGTGDGDVTIRSKFQTTSNGVVKTSVDRSIRYGMLTIDEKTVLLVSCHAPWGYEGHDGESAEAKAARATYYQEVCKWCNGDISLPDYYTQTPTNAPEHTYVIIGMDANCVTANDKTALLNAASTYGGYTLSNGGELGWVYSCFDSYGLTSIDEIMVSPNIIINGFEVLGNWFNLLYSDHYPVVADLTLL